MNNEQLREVVAEAKSVASFQYSSTPVNHEMNARIAEVILTAALREHSGPAIKQALQSGKPG
jgi:hypothetical protein